MFIIRLGFKWLLRMGKAHQIGRFSSKFVLAQNFSGSNPMVSIYYYFHSRGRKEGINLNRLEFNFGTFLSKKISYI